MLKFLLLACSLAFFLPAAHGQAANIYITPTGAATGVCTTGTQAPSFFNNAANWGNGGGQIGPGTIVHLCGVITGTLNTSILTAQGSGAFGNPITILFEPGARLSSPACAGNFGGACLDLTNRSDITVNGDASNGRQGIVENTANGTVLANHIPSTGIRVSGTTRVIVKNTNVRNIYVHTAVSDCITQNTDTRGIYGSNSGATNLTIDNNLVSDVSWAIDATGNNLEIKNNETFNMDHGIANGVNGTTTGESFHNNHFHDMANWNSTGDCYHHDGIHVFTEGGDATGGQIYDNLFDGSLGVNTTAWIFLEGSSSGSPTGVHNWKIYNNLFENGDASNPNKKLLWLEGRGKSSGQEVYNNFASILNNTNELSLYCRSTTGVKVKNNVFGPQTYAGCTIAAPGDVDNNVYFNVGNDINFGWNGAQFLTVAQWRTACNCDANAQQGSSAQININPTTGVPGAGSIAIGAGINLTSLGVTALNSDYLNSPRPTSGAWTSGALNVASSGNAQIAIAPSSFDFGNQTQHVTSGAQSFHITNPGTANLNFSPNPPGCCGISGTNASDFVITSKTCVDAGTIVPTSGFCDISVTFTPNLQTLEKASLQLFSNASGGSPVSIPLQGTGVAPATAALQLTPNPVNFTSTPVGSNGQTLTVTVKNVGTATYTPNNPTFFSISNLNWSKQGGTCGTATLAVNATCTMDIRFNPSSAGSLSATLSAVGNVVGNTTLNGTGVATTNPIVVVTPTPFDFGNQPKGVTSALHNFSISVTGSGSVILGTPFFTITGGNRPTDFARVSPGGADCLNGQTLAVGDPPCLISVAFTPLITGAENTVLTIKSNAASPAPTSALSGTGIAPSLQLSPSPAGFGSSNVGSTAGPLVVTAKNVGNSTLTFPVSPFTLTGANPSNFSIISNTCNALQTGTLTVTSAGGGLLNYVFTSTHGLPNVSFTVPANPTPGASTAGYGFSMVGAAQGLTNVVVNGVSQSSNPLIEVVFYNSSVIGGFRLLSDTSTIIVSVGPTQLYTGAEATPTLTLQAGTVLTNNVGAPVSGTLDPGATCTINLNFTPSVAGSRSATFNAASNAGTITDNLSGTGVALVSSLTLTPRPTVFPTEPTGTTSVGIVTTVTNVGGGLHTFGSPKFSFTTGDASDWANISTTCGATLAAAASCTFTNSFTPTGSPRNETTLFTATGTTTPGTGTVAFNGAGVSPSPGGAPVPWVASISFSNGYQSVEVAGTGFTSENAITIQGQPIPTACTDVLCKGNLPSCVGNPCVPASWLPYQGQKLSVGLK